MSYYTEEDQLNPVLFRQLDIIKCMPTRKFAEFIVNNVQMISDDNEFLDFTCCFSSLINQRISLILALLYTQNVLKTLNNRKSSKPLILACCYSIACDMYGLDVKLLHLSKITGFIPQRISIAKLCILELLEYQLYIKEIEFQEFLSVILIEYEDNIQHFLGMTLMEILLEPRDISAEQEIDNDNFTDAISMDIQEIRDDDVLMFKDIWKAL
ncbi:hypothetical protein SS50377_25443 [Spironucleus salmonicida]|uniref:Uncharacterized protein n=1 Tax=Spironucleus salmonicida TaxID=348837 RepID=V6LMQ2_9EUKA|nr:hypothetical protein SS50377_25443 [Spironucleus salmonicida]|eukprot:EST44991.1 Hypothetical protein SS50377_15010 [Spironucleus salmonicida]